MQGFAGVCTLASILGTLGWFGCAWAPAGGKAAESALRAPAGVLRVGADVTGANMGPNSKVLYTYKGEPSQISLQFSNPT